jgi:hypothetical protein
LTPRRQYNTFKLQKVLTADERQKANEELNACDMSGDFSIALHEPPSVTANDDKAIAGPIVKFKTRLNGGDHTKKWATSKTGQFAKVCGDVVMW